MPHEDVVAFNVAVDCMDGMGRRESLRQLREKADHLLGGGNVPTRPFIQGSALDPFHDEVGVLHSGSRAPDATAQQAGNAGVMDAGEHVSLAREARIPWVERKLEGNRAGLLLACAHGAVDTTVRALAAMLQHSPPVDLGAWRKQRIRCVLEGHRRALKATRE
jgi:hypothetical protein